jgi:hypothetical protein
MGRALAGDSWLVPTMAEMHELHKRTSKWDEDYEEADEGGEAAGAEPEQVPIDSSDDRGVDNKDQLAFEKMLLNTRARGVLSKQEIDEAGSYWGDNRDRGARMSYEKK